MVLESIMMRPLSTEVQTAWELFEAIRRNNHLEMHEAVRVFAMKMVEQQTDQNRIVVAGRVFRTFPNAEYASKQSYIADMSRRGTWLDDAAIFAAMNALGYQTVVHLQGTDLPPYVPYVQQASDTPLKFDIANHGAKRGGIHWERLGCSNPGRGDCGAYACAQQIQQDRPEIISHLNEVAIREMQTVLNAAANTVTVPIIPQQREDNAVTREVVAQFKRLEQSDNQHRDAVIAKFKNLSTLQLARIYNYLLVNNVGDYLAGRVKYMEQECDLNPRDEKNFIREALEKCQIDPEHDETINELLIEALATEAWRSEESYNLLMGLDASQLAESKKSYQEPAEHTGINIHQAQPGFKTPRLVC